MTSDAWRRSAGASAGCSTWLRSVSLRPRTCGRGDRANDARAPRARGRARRESRRAAVAASGDQPQPLPRLRLVREGLPGRRRARARPRQGRAGRSRARASVTAPAATPVRSTPSRSCSAPRSAGVEIPRLGPRLPDRRAGHLRRRRARRDGTDPQRRRAGAPGDGSRSRVACRASAAATRSTS